MRYFIELSYYGKHYHGWQIQPQSVSVQEVLQNQMRKILPGFSEVVGAGRTDAGVHAKQLFAHFDLTEEIDVAEMAYKLNCMLPDDIAIAEIFPVTEEAHARFDATSRSYEYHIIQEKDVFNRELAWFFKPELDLEKMNSAAAILKEYSDFQCFSRSRTDVRTYICQIFHAEWKKEKISWFFIFLPTDFFETWFAPSWERWWKSGSENCRSQRCMKS
ncbi:tRNA pseudouridine synthase A [Christiangramia flava JLT2011]|nr:tRNA pseudouridine synthase A [Christiangramia flava JLT2011]